MKKHVEIEARWINLDTALMQRKLKNIGAKKISAAFFREWIFLYPWWIRKNRRIRVRTDGKKTWLTYKANAKWELDSTEEVEVRVSSAEDIVKLLKKARIPLRLYQEKKRITYKVKDIIFDLDFWPKIPMVLEIEAQSKKKVKEGAAALGLKWKDAIFENQRIVHEKYYGINLDSVREYRFTKKS